MKTYTAAEVTREIRASAWCFGWERDRAAVKGNRSYLTDAQKLRTMAHDGTDLLNDSAAATLAMALLYRAAYYGTLPDTDAAHHWHRLEARP